MVYIIVGIVLFIISLFILYKAYKIKIQKKEQIQTNKIELELLDKVLFKNHQKLQLQQKQLEENNKKLFLIKNEIQQNYQIINNDYANFKADAQNAFSQYEKNLDQIYSQKEKQLTEHINNIKKEQELYQSERDQAKKELTQIKKTIEAAAAARIVEQEKNNKWLFYSLDLTSQQLNDILELNNFKHRLNDPSLVGKIIWSAFILKATNDLCSRVLGTSKKCGIYKITNRETKQVYIGQSLSVADRWKAHIKCGLGIDAPVTNKLYQKMQYYGVWMFTFELLEECSKDKLNEREKFWIEFYQSDKTGMNSKGGNK